MHSRKAPNQGTPKKNRGLTRRALWLIASYKASRLDVLTISTEGDGECLPIFSFEEEAETFLRLSGDDGAAGWWIRKAAPGELVSLLLAPCAQVKWVALDPLPLSFGRGMFPFFGVARKRFVEDLLLGRKRGGTAAEPLVPA